MERVQELIHRAATLGIKVRIDFGLVVVTLAAGDPDRQLTAVKELGDHISNVRLLLEQRSTSARALELIGQRAWVPEIGIVTLASCSTSGQIVVTTDNRAYGRRAAQVTASAHSTLIIEEEPQPESASHDAAEISCGPIRRLFDASLRSLTALL
jgi:hypothetical protein